MFFARVLFALLAAAALAASMGVAAPPHQVPAGTPLFHNLVLGAYRFAFLIEPARPTDALTPEMAALHRTLALAGIPVTAMPGMESAPARDDGPILATSGLNPAQDLAIEFALLVVLVPRLTRPSRRVIAALAMPSIRAPQWRQLLTLAPPRLVVRAFAIA